MNRATADNQSAQAEEEGLEPTKEWVKDLIDELLADEFASPDLELTWLDEDTNEKTEQAQFEARVKIGAATLNELRDALGLDPFDVPAADRPMVLTATGYVPIEANVSRPGAGAQSVLENPPAGRRNASPVRKYSPDQPRVPAGNPDGGQWTRDGGDAESSDVTGSSSAPVAHGATLGPQYAALDTGTRTDAVSAPLAGSEQDGDSSEHRIELASDWQSLPVNLVEEEAPIGIGHAIREHVGKTDIELLEALDRKSYRGPLIDIIDGAEGSFDSIENANDLVNRTLRANSQRVDLVASGKLEDDFIEQRFGFVTGREAYRPDADTEPRMRNTYAVGVYIWHDEHSPRGFRVRTAYPRND